MDIFEYLKHKNVSKLSDITDEPQTVDGKFTML